WTATAGKDPLFAAVDGMNCPNLAPGDPRSHSQLLERGLFRVALPWPPQRADGTRIDPEFTIDGVRDPWPTRSTRPTRTSASVRSSARTACPRLSIRRRAGRRA